MLPRDKSGRSVRRKRLLTPTIFILLPKTARPKNRTCHAFVHVASRSFSSFPENLSTPFFTSFSPCRIYDAGYSEQRTFRSEARSFIDLFAIDLFSEKSMCFQCFIKYRTVYCVSFPIKMPEGDRNERIFSIHMIATLRCCQRINKST